MGARILVIACLMGTASCGRYQFEAQLDASQVAAADDGGSDARQASNCAVTFCDDFDGGTVGAGWDPPIMVGTSRFSVATDSTLSAPSSLL